MRISSVAIGLWDIPSWQPLPGIYAGYKAQSLILRPGESYDTTLGLERFTIGIVLLAKNLLMEKTWATKIVFSTRHYAAAGGHFQ